MDKEIFDQYLERNGYKKATRGHYVGAIFGYNVMISVRLRELGIVKNSISELDDLVKLKETVVVLQSDEKFIEQNDRGNRMYSNALDCYVKCFTEINQDNYVVVESDHVENHPSSFPLNLILFGAPGTGKSYILHKDYEQELLGDDMKAERVTFHPDYSYANFVGTYKPVSIDSNVKLDPDISEVINILTDGGKFAQDKYDALLDRFQNDKKYGGATMLPILVALSSDDKDDFITTRKNDEQTANYGPSISNGKKLKKYVSFKTVAQDNGGITYEFVPGPFMRIYVDALKYPDIPHVLIIEEINRANVAAVFGDVFQLLDRGSDGMSEYEIAASEDIRKYLDRMGVPGDHSTLRIPKNMYIWATMNSADQGVFPMDTAFKRRWHFRYIGINDSAENIKNKTVNLPNGELNWNCLRMAINDFLADKGINEDKQMGPYFISADIIAPEDGAEINPDKFIEAFKNKVIMYLYEDAARQKRQEVFEGCWKEGLKRYSEICGIFDSNIGNISGKGIKIFHPDIVDKYNNYLERLNAV